MSDAGRKIERDLACVRCGYNLRGLTSVDYCPECNALVSASVLRQGFLRFVTHAPPLVESDARWVRSIVSGMGWFVATIGTQFLTPFVMGYNFDPTTGWIVKSMLAAVAWMMFAAGVLKLSRREPGAADSGVWILRAAAGLYVMISGLQLAWPRAPSLLLAFGGGAALVTTLLLHAHLGNIACRLPSKWLTILARVASYVLGIAGCTATIGAMGAFVGPATFGPVADVSKILLPGGIDAALQRPMQSILTISMAAMGCTPIYFLLIWYARPHQGRMREMS